MVHIPRGTKQLLRTVASILIQNVSGEHILREKTHFFIIICSRQSGKGHWVCYLSWEHLHGLYWYTQRGMFLAEWALGSASHSSPILSCPTEHSQTAHWSVLGVQNHRCTEDILPDFLGKQVAWKQIWRGSAATIRQVITTGQNNQTKWKLCKKKQIVNWMIALLYQEWATSTSNNARASGVTECTWRM